LRGVGVSIVIQKRTPVHHQKSRAGFNAAPLKKFEFV
jgi:hypothetical protein